MVSSNKMIAFLRSKLGLVVLSAATALALLTPSVLSAAAIQQPAAQIELFNGKDLSGWVNVNCAPETWQVRDGLIICSGTPRGVLRTDQMYENFVLELEWRHTKPKGNSGLMVFADALPQIGGPFPGPGGGPHMRGGHGSLSRVRGLAPDPATHPRPPTQAGPGPPPAHLP